MSKWVVQRMWEGQTVAILASGESMSSEIANRIRYETAVRVIVVNNTFRLAPWADLLYAADARWWDVYKREALAFDGLKVCIEETPFPEVLVLNKTGERGFDPNPGNLRTGKNSGYQAVHLAIHTGVKTILLCGFDMHGGHWHGEHQNPLRATDKDVYPYWIEEFRILQKEMPATVQVLNCTPDSAMKCFPLVDLSKALFNLKEEACAPFA